MIDSHTLVFLNRFWKECTREGRPFLLKIASNDSNRIHVYEGEEVVFLDSIQEIDRGCKDFSTQCFMLPYSAISERGSCAVVDGLKPMMFEVTNLRSLPISENDRTYAMHFARTTNAGLSILPSNSDEEQREMFKYAQKTLIESGEGCNFVFRRDYFVKFPRSIHTTQAAWACFLGVFSADSVGYWNYAWFDGESFVIGASPEPLLTLNNGNAEMMPISGTHKGVVDKRSLEQFLLDEKEIYELDMVLDEELKIMSKLCREKVSVDGPRIIQSGDILHTGFSIKGKLTSSLGDALLQVLGAPTVVGSPAISAEKHIASIERNSRGYYAGACGVIQNIPGEHPSLESALVIRSLELNVEEHIGKISAGATIVRDSDAALEVAEVDAKAYSVARVMGFAEDTPVEKAYTSENAEQVLKTSSKIIESSRIKDIIEHRSQRIPTVWRELGDNKKSAEKVNGNILLIECGDNFIWMIAHILQRKNYEISVVKWDCSGINLSIFDCIILGPGPGDPKINDLRAQAISSWAQRAREENLAVCAVCLSHQILAKYEGYEIARMTGKTAQGCRTEFNIGGGEKQKFATYNSFEVIDPRTKVVLNYRKYHGFRSFQWHPESVLSEDGDHFLVREVGDAINEMRNNR